MNETETASQLYPILVSLLPILITYFFGIITGFLLRVILERVINKDKKEDFNKTLIGFAIVMMWVITNLVDLIDPNYSTPLAIQLIMGSLAGVYFKPIDFSRIIKK